MRGKSGIFEKNRVNIDDLIIKSDKQRKLGNNLDNGKV